MKKGLLLFVLALPLLAACAANTAETDQKLASMAEELTNAQNNMAMMQETIDNLTLKNEALNTEITQNTDTIAELQTEVTYLSNELTIIKNPKQAATPVTATPAAVSADNQTQAPRIVIIEDTVSMKDSLYSYAYEQYRQGKYNESIAKFQEFLDKMPNDDLADNSQYWIGENYYSMRDFPKALEAFETVLNKYPKGGKVPDAMLKIGYTYRETGQKTKATEALNQLLKAYPKSSAATLAKQSLAKWK